jgi:hypothetical protein
MKPYLLRLGAIAMCALLLTSAYNRTNSASVTTEAANRLLSALTPEQRAKATFKFEDDERMNWHFIPKERKGLPLREMTSYQKHLATVLLAAGLSQNGFMKALTIMSLEDILKQQEKDDGERRNPEKYYFSIFGTPSETGTWGYRVEGHHMAQNFTIAGGHVVDAPSFFGSNPAEVKQGPRAGLRVLAAEDDLGRDVLMSLDDAQRKIAVLDKTAYKDIITMASRKAAIEGQPSGLAASKMTSKQFDKLMALLDEYASNVPTPMRMEREAVIKKAGKNMYFAWTGVAEKGGPHYYRVQSPTFIIEYDNTQNDANHIHSVWRDLNNDFGGDLLKAHYRASH